MFYYATNKIKESLLKTNEFNALNMNLGVKSD
jgi:hypothetical protein